MIHHTGDRVYVPHRHQIMTVVEVIDHNQFGAFDALKLRNDAGETTEIQPQAVCPSAADTKAKERVA